MALGSVDHLHTDVTRDAKRGRWFVQLSSGANWTAAGEIIDFSKTTRGATRGFDRVDGVHLVAYSGDPAGDDQGLHIVYDRYTSTDGQGANQGMPQSGLLRVFEAGADGAPLDAVADNTDLSNFRVIMEVIGRG